MFNFFRKPLDRLIIDNGRVFCPIRTRDTDIDYCVACPRLRDIDPAANPPYVRCRLESRVPLGAMYF